MGLTLGEGPPSWPLRCARNSRKLIYSSKWPKIEVYSLHFPTSWDTIDARMTTNFGKGSIWSCKVSVQSWIMGSPQNFYHMSAKSYGSLSFSFTHKFPSIGSSTHVSHCWVIFPWHIVLHGFIIYMNNEASWVMIIFILKSQIPVNMNCILQFWVIRGLFWQTFHRLAFSPPTFTWHHVKNKCWRGYKFNLSTNFDFDHWDIISNMDLFLPKYSPKALGSIVTYDDRLPSTSMMLFMNILL